MSIKENDKQYIANTYARFDIEVEKGDGALIYDFSGKEYIDLSGGIAVNTFGAADPIWYKAVCEQALKIQHISNLYYTKPQTDLAKMLCEKTGLCKAFFSNSGAEANECAIKTARKYSFDKYGEGRSTIVTLKNSFHGRTVTTLAATGQDSFHTVFGPFTEGFTYAVANDIDDLTAKASQKDVCAIMMETIQGEGGVIPLENDFVSAAAELCEKNDLLMIIDEVQTGNGRTGKLYSYMHYGITPDIVSTAKGLAGGLPMGATLFGQRVKDTLTPGTHGSTFGGNPVCAAAALSVIERLDDDLLCEVERKGKKIVELLSDCEKIESITGRGLMLGIKIKGDAKAVVNECISRGVILLTAKDKIRLLPPLCITDGQIEKAINILKEVI